MKRILISLVLMLAAATVVAHDARPIALVIHGGAGTITRESMTPEREKEYREKLEEALRIGYAILEKGGSALDAVEATIRVMEDSPLFNAGKGAVFTHDGRNELDASIMDGKDHKAGAVAGVTIVRNPISAARAVMEKSVHVMMSGRGAELFATQAGLEIVDPSYFWTERRWKSLQNELMKEQKSGERKETFDPRLADQKFGTVGAVALDREGNLAAGTSTGGMTNKKFGRIGDSPVIGAGTWADNGTCGVSATGHGEYFIRWGVAQEIAARMAWGGQNVEEAASAVIAELKEIGGEGGVIAMDAKGNIATPFNTEGMYRGWIREDEGPAVEIYGEELHE